MKCSFLDVGKSYVIITCGSKKKQKIRCRHFRCKTANKMKFLNIHELRVSVEENNDNTD